MASAHAIESSSYRRCCAGKEEQHHNEVAETREVLRNARAEKKVGYIRPCSFPPLPIPHFHFLSLYNKSSRSLTPGWWNCPRKGMRFREKQKKKGA
jgi:hypothetical protein